MPLRSKSDAQILLKPATGSSLKRGRTSKDGGLDSLASHGQRQQEGGDEHTHRHHHHHHDHNHQHHRQHHRRGEGAKASKDDQRMQSLRSHRAANASRLPHTTDGTAGDRNSTGRELAADDEAAAGQRRTRQSRALHQQEHNHPRQAPHRATLTLQHEAAVTSKLLAWQRLQPQGWSPAGRTGHSAVEMQDGVMYIFGGYEGASRVNSLLRFEFATMRWRVMRPPRTSYVPRAPSLSTVTERATVTGAASATAEETARENDEETGQRRPPGTPSHPSPILRQSSAEDVVLSPSRPHADIWPVPRAYHASWAFHNMLFVHGGECAPEDAPEFDEANTLSPEDDLAYANHQDAVAAPAEASSASQTPPMSNTTAGRKVLDDLHCYNPKTNRWRELRPCIRPLPRKGHTTVLCHHRDEPFVLMFGGCTAAAKAVSGAAFVAPADTLAEGGIHIAWRRIKPRGRPPLARYRHTCTVLSTEREEPGDGNSSTLAICGGLTLAGDALNDVVLLDMANMSWIHMSHARGYVPPPMFAHAACCISPPPGDELHGSESGAIKDAATRDLPSLLIYGGQVASTHQDDVDAVAHLPASGGTAAEEAENRFSSECSHQLYVLHVPTQRWRAVRTSFVLPNSRRDHIMLHLHKCSLIHTAPSVLPSTSAAVAATAAAAAAGASPQPGGGGESPAAATSGSVPSAQERVGQMQQASRGSSGGYPVRDRQGDTKQGANLSADVRVAAKMSAVWDSRQSGRGCVVVFGGCNSSYRNADMWGIELRWRNAGVHQFDDTMGAMLERAASAPELLGRGADVAELDGAKGDGPLQGSGFRAVHDIRASRLMLHPTVSTVSSSASSASATAMGSATIAAAVARSNKEQGRGENMDHEVAPETNSPSPTAALDPERLSMLEQDVAKELMRVHKDRVAALLELTKEADQRRTLAAENEMLRRTIAELEEQSVREQEANATLMTAVSHENDHLREQLEQTRKDLAAAMTELAESPSADTRRVAFTPLQEGEWPERDALRNAALPPPKETTNRSHTRSCGTQTLDK